MPKHSPAGRSVVLRSVSAGILAQVAVISVSISGAGHSTVADQVLTYDGIEYVCTGVAETRDDPRWQRYPLKLVFATEKGEYLADVSVKVEDASGNLALEADCDAPWLVADLPAGSYEVTATASGGHTETVSVQVTGGKQVEATLRYPEPPAK